MVSVERSQVIAASQQFRFPLAGVSDLPLPRRTHRQIDAVNGAARPGEPQSETVDGHDATREDQQRHQHADLRSVCEALDTLALASKAGSVFCPV
jgi:hypothetical protein